MSGSQHLREGRQTRLISPLLKQGVLRRILIKQIAMAIQGSTKAATFIRDTAGQKILKDATENNTNYEDDGFIDAIHRSSKDVWK